VLNSNFPWERLLRASEVAKILGVSKQLVYKEIKKGNLPAYKFGGRVVIDSADLVRYLESNRMNDQEGYGEQ
jgi:excisionase family DNA binding protein